LDQYTEIARLAGSLAHEIKNPLSTIRLNMELLAEDIGEPQTPAQRRALKRVEVVRRECLRLQALLDDFLNYAKVRRLHLEPSDLNHQIADVLDFFAPEAEEAGIEIVRYLDPDLPRVLLDRETFRRALLNLILNAKQAMPDGGQLVVRTAANGDTAAVYLIDNGVGMDEHTAAKMFEAFFSTKPGGSGLGLPTTQKIIAGHGGRINVQSELGRGTQITIELPVPARIGGSEINHGDSEGTEK
jgi:signal transduction histidine kinase